MLCWLPLHKTMKFSIQDFFSKCDEIRNFRQSRSHLLKKSLIEKFIFCAVYSLPFRLPFSLSLLKFIWSFCLECWQNTKKYLTKAFHFLLLNLSVNCQRNILFLQQIYAYVSASFLHPSWFSWLFVLRYGFCNAEVSMNTWLSFPAIYSAWFAFVYFVFNEWYLFLSDQGRDFSRCHSSMSNTQFSLTLREKCPYLEFLWSAFSPNAGKYGPEKLRIRIFFTQRNSSSSSP